MSILRFFKKHGYDMKAKKEGTGTKLYCKEFWVTFKIQGKTLIIQDINGVGYGSLILESLEDLAKKLKLKKIVANNFSPRSKNFWLKEGFTGTGRNLEKDI